MRRLVLQPTRCLLAAALALCATFSSHAYETATHAVLSQEAANASVIATTPVLSDYGLDPSISDSTQRFPSFAGQQRTILDLIVDGSRLEDELAEDRALNHFFNPRDGRPLNIGGTPVLGAIASPEWGLAGRGAYPKQDRSYWDARQYLLDGLTKQSETDRKQALGRAFQSLGHVVHLLQDMAQPQHVRNEMHCDLIFRCGVLTLGILYRPSFYEKYTRSLGANLPTAPGRTGFDVQGPLFTAAVDRPRRFWNTMDGPDSPADGSGLAEYTQRNFVSSRNNFRSSSGGFAPASDFPLPAPTSTPANVERVDVRALMPGTAMEGEVWFVANDVVDRITGISTPNPRAGSFSSFDEDLQRLAPAFGRVFTLNEFNFRAAHEFLIPRAVAYSAGMINYFFRGKIDLQRDTQNPDMFRVVNLGSERISGRFALYYDALDGNRYPLVAGAPNADPSDHWQLEIQKLDPATPNSNLSVPISFTPPPSSGPLSAKNPSEYLLVFNGDMGNEVAGTNMVGAVAAKMVLAPYNSVLYILAADAANQRIALRVDKNGTRVVPATEFHPLRNVFIPTNIGQGLAKAYVNRQVKFTQHTFGYSYETLATSVGVHIPGLGASAIGLWKNPASGNFETAGEMAWTAKSGDPLIGHFRFRPILPESNLAASRLEVQRRYVDAAGSPQTVTTTIPLPPPPMDFSNYLGFVQGGLVVSPDGLAVSGFRKNIFLPDNTVVEERHDLRVELAEVPVLSFVKTGQQVIGSNTTTFTPLTTQTIDTLSVGFPCLPNPIPTPLRRTTLFAEQQITNDNLTFLDYYNDVLHSYRRVDNSHGLLSYTETGASISACNLAFIQTQGETIDIRDTTGGYIFSSGGVLANLVHSNESQFNRQNLGPWNRTWNFNYFGGAPIPPIPRTSTETPATFTLYSDIFPIGPNSGDAVYSLATTGSPSVRKFRSTNVSNNFVGDASPIGEVFFAHTDLSLVVHEPKRGPQVQFPQNVVRLIAAMWM